MVDPSCGREADIAGESSLLMWVQLEVEYSLLVKNSQLTCREVFGLDPHPYMFTVDTLLNLVQWFSREHLVDVNIIAEEHEEYVLGLGIQCRKLGEG